MCSRGVTFTTPRARRSAATATAPLIEIAMRIRTATGLPGPPVHLFTSVTAVTTLLMVDVAVARTRDLGNSHLLGHLVISSLVLDYPGFTEARITATIYLFPHKGQAWYAQKALEKSFTKTLSVESGDTMSLKCITMLFCAITFMNFKLILWIFFRYLNHVSVAGDFCHD